MLPQALALGSAIGGKLIDGALGLGGSGGGAMTPDQLRGGNVNVGTKIVGKGNSGSTAQSAGDSPAPSPFTNGELAAAAPGRLPAWVWPVVAVLGLGLVVSLLAAFRRR